MATTSSVSKKIEALKAFYQSGKTQDIDYRLTVLKKLYTTLKVMEGEIAAALYKDLHKSSFESYMTETGIVLEELSLIIRSLKKWAKPKPVTTPFGFLPGSSRVVSEPYGTALVISPWNYPFQLAFSPLIGALAAGNTVLLKTSELSKHTSRIIAKIVKEVFEPGHVTALASDVTETTHILKQKFDYIFFTGSTRVGKVVMKAAAENLTPVTLELGGKCPTIVHSDADVALSAKRIAWGKCTNAGQTCVAPDYIYLHESIKDEFIEAFKTSVAELTEKQITKSEYYGRIINKAHYERLCSYLSQGEIVAGGQTHDRSRFIEPTILENVESDAPVMQDEIFGPILPLYSYSDIDEPLAFINSRPKPLALYLFSKSKELQQQLIAKTSAGGTAINDTVVQVANPYLPFGGVGDSGIGAYHGKHSFDLFSHQRSILDRATLFDPPFRYTPSTKLNFKLLKLFLG